MNTLAAIVIVLLLLTMLLLARVLAIWWARKNKHSSKLHGKNDAHQPKLLLGFLIAFLSCVLISTVYYFNHLLPSPPAYPANEVQPLLHVTTAITAIAFFVTQVLLFYFAFRYHQQRGKSASFIKGSMKLELFWTIIPLLFFIFLFIWGEMLWQKVITQPEDGLEIEVMAEQFNWMVRYSGADKKMGAASFRFISEKNAMGVDITDPASADDFIPVQMHIPKNKPVRLTLRSKDVIHSFYIPFFRSKMDAVPGMTTSLHFTATATTEEMRRKLNEPEFDYEVACAELCGRMHFAMKLVLVVDEEAAFNNWYRQQQPWRTAHAEQSSR